jgi:membrane fusion protein, copper/silver efflux system
MSASERPPGLNGRDPLAAPRRGWRALRRALRLARVRLRVPMVLVVAALVVGRWDVIRNYWDTFTRAATGEGSAARAVSNDTEYFCPMDPGVVSDWPGKCGVCNMALVRRKRGEAVALPDGVVARMQLSPYRVQLAGIRTEPVEYRPLARECEAAGTIEHKEGRPTVAAEFAGRDAAWVAEGLDAAVACDDLPGRDPFAAKVRSLARDPAGVRAVIEVADPRGELRDGMVVAARVRLPIAQVEPFRSLPRDPPPLRKGEPRRVFACPDHPDSLAEAPGRCPIDQNERAPSPLADNQRLRWWCPMHPEVASERPGGTCKACEGMALRPRVVTYSPPGQVLAVPESAVVDTGTKAVVYVEGMPGMFDGVEVALGPRCGGFYPVARGLEPGQRVASAGAFLLDAETRLNPGLAAAYFGAGRGSGATASRPASPPAAPTPLDGLAPEDRAIAERQKVCPVTRKPLGSMGTPTRLVVSGRVVFLCCEGCEGKLRGDPAKYLATIPATPSP